MKQLNQASLSHLTENVSDLMWAVFADAGIVVSNASAGYVNSSSRGRQQALRAWVADVKTLCSPSIGWDACVGGQLAYRDGAHLSVGGSMLLELALLEQLRGATGAR